MAAPFRYTDFYPEARLIGCVGRYDIIEVRFPPGTVDPAFHGRIIADFSADDAGFFILREPGGPFRLKRPQNTPTHYDMPTKAEREAMLLMVNTFAPREKGTPT